MEERYCITFAGVPGSSKTPIAYYLSWNLGLPIYNNDAIRTEVQEDLLKFDQELYLKRRDERGKRLISSGRSFIYDASVDREWSHLSELLKENDYKFFIISLDLSRELIEKLYEAKGYKETPEGLNLLLQQHQVFLKNQQELIGIHISDSDFSNRLELSLDAVRTTWVQF